MSNQNSRTMNFFTKAMRTVATGMILIAATTLPSNAQSCVANYTFTTGANGQVNFTNTSTGAIMPMYVWNFGDGNYAYTTNATHTYTNNGMYYACLTMYDSLSSCQATYCDTVIISNVTSSCNANFSFVIGANGQVTFTNTSTGGTSPYYYWSFGDGNYSYTTNASHTYASNGTYNVCLNMYDSLSSCQDVYCTNITITNASQNPGCNASFTFTGQGNTLNFTNTSTGGSAFGTTYAWNFGDNGSSTQISPSHTYAQSGAYVVCLTMTVVDSSGTCTDIFCDTITISGIGQLQFDGGLNLFPNPANAGADLEYENGGYDWIVIEWFTSEGRQMSSQRLPGGSGKHRVHFETQDMAEGLYFVRISTPEFSTVRRVSVIH